MEPAAAPAGGVGCLDDLGIDDHGRRPGAAALVHAQPAPQPVHQRPGKPALAPPLEELVHRRVRREVRRQGPPLDPVPDHVEHRVQHCPQVMHHRAPAHLDQLGHHHPGLRPEHPPLLIGGVRRTGRRAVVTPASGRRAASASDRDRVDRHPGLLVLEGVDTSPLPGVLFLPGPARPGVTRLTRATPLRPGQLFFIYRL